MPRLSLILAWSALLWERAAPVLAPGLGALALYLIATLFGVWDAFGDPARALAFLGLAGAAVWATRRALTGWTWPSGEEAARRVEEDSGLAERPHEALIDEPAGHDPVAQRLWEEHRRRMQARLAGARARRPKPAWASMDQHAVRGALAVMLLAGVFAAGENRGVRLDDAFGLRVLSPVRESAVLDAWIDPPAYTGRAPVLLDADAFSATAPQGSVFVARLAGARRPPRLTSDSEAGESRAEIAEIGDGVWEARLTLLADSELALRSGGVRRAWTVGVIPDAPPEALLVGSPEGTSRGELEFAFVVSDDYGAERLALEFRPEDEAEAEWSSLDVGSAAPADIEDEPEARQGSVESAKHPLAGQRVELRLAAFDAAGNIGRSETIGLTLPERVFLDALARAVAEQRRDVLGGRGAYAPLEARAPIEAGAVPPGEQVLSSDPARRIERAPQALQDAAVALTAITDTPERFFDDPIVYLGLREALFRLQRAGSNADLGDLEEDLWQIALRAELGSLADAEAALRAAERALAEALARGADETELAALFDAYEQAMENYVAALAREAVEEGRTAGEGGGGSMDSDMLQQLLADLREAAELGGTAEARQALALLTELLRNMELQLFSGGEGEGDDELSEAIREALEEFSDVIGEQRELQEETFNLGQDPDGAGAPQSGPGEPGQDGTGAEGAPRPSAGELAERQSELAGGLGEALESLPEGQGGQALEDAVEAMENAAGALGAGDPYAALDAQDEALQQLREGAEALAQQLRDREDELRGDNGEQGERDPLGRAAGQGSGGDDSLDLSGEAGRERAREILEELRRRAAEAGRPAEELDYIQRLLDRFGS